MDGNSEPLEAEYSIVGGYSDSNTKGTMSRVKGKVGFPFPNASDRYRPSILGCNASTPFLFFIFFPLGSGHTNTRQ